MWADNSEKENNDDKKVEYNNKLHDFGTILYCFYVSIKNSIDKLVLTYLYVMYIMCPSKILEIAFYRFLKSKVEQKQIGPKFHSRTALIFPAKHVAPCSPEQSEHCCGRRPSGLPPPHCLRCHVDMAPSPPPSPFPPPPPPPPSPTDLPVAPSPPLNPTTSNNPNNPKLLGAPPLIPVVVAAKRWKSTAVT
jgi:hypothetical protein